MLNSLPNSTNHQNKAANEFDDYLNYKVKGSPMEHSPEGDTVSVNQTPKRIRGGLASSNKVNTSIRGGTMRT